MQPPRYHNNVRQWSPIYTIYECFNLAFKKYNFHTKTKCLQILYIAILSFLLVSNDCTTTEWISWCRRITVSGYRHSNFRIEFFILFLPIFYESSTIKRWIKYISIRIFFKNLLFLTKSDVLKTIWFGYFLESIAKPCLL